MKRTRTPGDDVDITVRVRKSNLQALLDGVELGVDVMTEAPTVLRLVTIGDNIYSIYVVTSIPALLATPDPVDVRPVGGESKS